MSTYLQVITNRMLKRMPPGVCSVSPCTAVPHSVHASHSVHVNSPDVKMDWCNTKVNGTQLDPKVQYAEMVKPVNASHHILKLCTSHMQSKELNATGKPIFFNSCEWGVEEPWLWMKQYANSWRSGPDHHDEWKSTADIIENNVGKGKYAGTW